MAISRKEIGDIAQSAASKVMVSERCKELGVRLLNSREVLQTALDLAAHAKRPEDIVSSGLAKDMINLAKDLSRDVELTGEEAMRLEVNLASALDLVNKADYDAAISKILQARGDLLDLMFQEVVTCECGEAKAIEEKLGKEALLKILGHPEPETVRKRVAECVREIIEAPKGSNPSNPTTKYLVRLDPALATRPSEEKVFDSPDEAIAYAETLKAKMLPSDVVHVREGIGFDYKVIHRYQMPLPTKESNPGVKVRYQSGWTYAKVGQTEMRGKDTPTGIEFEQVSPTYDPNDLQKAVDTITAMFRKPPATGR